MDELMQEEQADIEINAVEAGQGVQWLSGGFELFKASPFMWVLLIFTMILIMGVLGVVPFLGQLAVNLVWPVFAAGLMAGCKAIDDGDELTFGHLFAGFSEKTGPLFGLGAAYLGMVIVLVIVLLILAAVMGFGISSLIMGAEAGNTQPDQAASVATILVLSLLMLGLMVPLAMATWFAPALIMLSDKSVVEALKLSFMGCLKNIVPFLVYGVVVFVLAMIAMIPFGLGLVLLLPVLSLSVYSAYRDIYD